MGDTIADSFIGERRDGLYGIFIGLFSLVVSSYFILIHYDFITFVEEGGWAELLSSLFLILLWLVSIPIL